MPTFYEQLVALERESAAFVLVVLVDALGSTPQDTGAKMLVTPAGLLAGTVGGGRIEAQAIALAQELLATGASSPRFVNWSLKADVGMTCGGSVKLYFEPHAATGTQARGADPRPKESSSSTCGSRHCGKENAAHASRSAWWQGGCQNATWHACCQSGCS